MHNVLGVGDRHALVLGRRHLAEVAQAPRRVALVPGQEVGQMVDRHAFGLGPAGDVDEGGEDVLNSLRGQARR